MHSPIPPKPASTTGPKILTFSGIAVLLLGIVALIFGITTMVSNLPLNIITAQGSPGSAALTALTVSEEFELSTTGGLSYDLWEVQQSPTGQFGLEPDTVSVIGPDGNPVAVEPTEVSGSSSVGAFKAQSFASFSAAKAGSYTIVITPGPGYSGPSTNFSGTEGLSADGLSADSPAPVDAVITEGSDFSSFFTGVFTSVGGIIVGVFALLVGGGLTIGGIAWWINANGRRKRGFTAGV